MYKIMTNNKFFQETHRGPADPVRFLPRGARICTPVLLLVVLTFLTGCAGFGIVDRQGFTRMAQTMERELAARDLPHTPAEIREAAGAPDKDYGPVLFRQLSPSFMQGQVAQYYIGETFAETLQPRRSVLTRRRNGFHIEHMTQHVDVSMLAVCDWNGDGDREWLVSCRVTPKRGKREKTWYLLVPPPTDSREVLPATTAAVLSCVGGDCRLELRKSDSIARREQAKIPPTEVRDFTPGQKAITAPSAAPGKTSALEERSL